MKNENIFQCEAEKGEIYRLLSRIYHLPDDKMALKVQTLKKLVAKSFADVFPYVAGMNKHVECDEDVETLKKDFSKLFIGPFGMLAPPYGSIYMEKQGTIMGDSTLDVVNRYREEGLGVSGDFHDAPDHIAAELEFAYLLIFKSLQTGRHSGMDTVRRYMAKRKRFLVEHIGAWISDFVQNVVENAKFDFYRNLAWCTELFIRKDLEDLSECKLIFCTEQMLLTRDDMLDLFT